MNHLIKTIQERNVLKNYEIFIDKNSEKHPVLDILRSQKIISEVDFNKQQLFTLTFKNNFLSVLYGNQKPIHVDFFETQLSRQALKTSRKDLICRALGLKTNQKHLIDFTAGMGKDSFIVSKYFEKVTLVERNPIVYLLLEDGFRRLTETHKELGQKFTLSFQEAEAFLTTEPINPESVFYFDFMFSDKKSKSHKEMFLLKHLTKNDEHIHEETLLNLALSKMPQRMVLKAKSYKGLLKSVQEYKGSTVSYYIFNNTSG